MANLSLDARLLGFHSNLQTPTPYQTQRKHNYVDGVVRRPRVAESMKRVPPQPPPRGRVAKCPKRGTFSRTRTRNPTRRPWKERQVCPREQELENAEGGGNMQYKPTTTRQRQGALRLQHSRDTSTFSFYLRCYVLTHARQHLAVSTGAASATVGAFAGGATNEAALQARPELRAGFG